MTPRPLPAFAIAAAVLLSAPVIARQAAQTPPSPDQVVAQLKQNLAENAKRLRQYEWIETSIINLKGEEKARKQQRAYYGADGKVTKLPIEGAPQAAGGGGGGGGRRGGRMAARIVENKKDDMQDYMEQAVALIHQYVPPTPELIQKARDAGTMTVQPPDQGILRIVFRDFVQKADSLTIGLDAKALLLSAVNVATYIEKPDDAVTLAVQFGTLTDGTSYSAKTTLAAEAKNIVVVIENSGHRPVGR